MFRRDLLFPWFIYVFIFLKMYLWMSLSYCLPHSLSVSTLPELWLSQFYSCRSGQGLFSAPGQAVLASTFCSRSFCVWAQPGIPRSAKSAFCHVCSASYSSGGSFLCFEEVFLEDKGAPQYFSPEQLSLVLHLLVPWASQILLFWSQESIFPWYAYKI